MSSNDISATGIFPEMDKQKCSTRKWTEQQQPAMPTVQLYGCTLTGSNGNPPNSTHPSETVPKSCNHNTAEVEAGGMQARATVDTVKSQMGYQHTTQNHASTQHTVMPAQNTKSSRRKRADWSPCHVPCSIHPHEATCRALC